MVLIVLIACLAAMALLYLAFLTRAVLASGPAVPRLEAVLLGAVTNFLDTLGIGSFAPTMAWMKFRGLVSDRLIPTTMLAGYTLPAMAQSAIFLVLLGVRVDAVLLVGCVVAIVAGAVVGAPIAARSSASVVQLIVALALIVAAFFYALSNFHLMPIGGQAARLGPALTAVAIAANFGLGVLLNFGVGNFAPTVAMLSLFGMDPRLAFPIMASGAAFAAGAAATRLVTVADLDFRVVIGLALGAVPAVLVAAFVVKEMPVEMLRWLVVVVVLYAAVMLLRSVASGGRGTNPTR